MFLGWQNVVFPILLRSLVPAEAKLCGLILILFLFQKESIEEISVVVPDHIKLVPLQQ